VIRLWHRIGVFRMLSVAVLVLGVAGGMYLSAARQSQQQRVLDSAQDSQLSAQEQARRLDILAADRSAASRSAQREAQSKADAAASAAADQARAAEDAARKAKQQTPPSQKPSTAPKIKKPPQVPIPASCSAYHGNAAVGCSVVLAAGYSMSDMVCVDNIFKRESGWRTNARNGSGAYGIPQSNPAAKMSVYGSDYMTNPATQVKWGLNYMKTRYGSPCAAWSVWQSKGWY